MAKNCFSTKYRKKLILYAFLIATFNQLSGINAILIMLEELEIRCITESAMMQSIVYWTDQPYFHYDRTILIDQEDEENSSIPNFSLDYSLALVAKRFYQDYFFRLLYAYLPDHRFLCHFTGCRHLGIIF